LEDWKKEHAEALNAIAAHDAQIYYKEEGLREGRKEGREEGREESLLTTIKSMLKEKCSFNLISKVTGKSIEEIKDIEKSMV